MRHFSFFAVALLLAPVALAGCKRAAPASLVAHGDTFAEMRTIKGDVTITSPGEAKRARIALADLLDVTLDREAHASGRGGSATERVRFALERREPELPVFVPEERITPIEAQEWYGKVRVFLRKHGWVPASERAATP